jgi:hypothetical protein
VHDVHRRTILREERSLLDRGVAAADHHEGLISEGRQRTVAHRTGRDALLPELSVVGARNVETLGSRARRDDDRVGAAFLRVGLEAEGAAREIDFVDGLRMDRRPESLRLRAKAIGQIGAHDALREAREVFDIRRGGQLAAGGDAARHETFEKHGAQLSTCRVNRCGVGCGSAPDDQDSMAHGTPFEAGVMHSRGRARNP